MAQDFNQEHIDLYLNKQLKGQTLSDFESRLSVDAEFKKEVETQAFLNRGINRFGADEMRNKLKKIRAEVLASSTPTEVESEAKTAKVLPLNERKKVRPFLRWSIAASIVLAMGAAFYFFINNNTVAPDKLYAAYYKPYNETITSRGNDTNTLINQASQLYQGKDYEAALPLFMEALQIEPNNAEIQLALGICQLETNQSEKANQTFTSITNPLYKEQAQWYLAMNFLKQSDLESAKTTLSEIQSGDFNYNKAQEILEAL